jgi:hypothetical protein
MGSDTIYSFSHLEYNYISSSGVYFLHVVMVFDIKTACRCEVNIQNIYLSDVIDIINNRE